MQMSVAAPRFGSKLTEMLAAERAPLLFGIRLWASVCLALFVVYELELDNPYWAGTTAAIVCQPQLGASLRKGWYRMIGTVIGAISIVVLTAFFPQDRVTFLVLLALWGAICGFTATVLHNFAAYSAALAGYTAAIIAADTLGATGGPNTDVFMLAISRASEICIGIVCAGVVLAGTDLGGARKRLAALFAGLAAEIAGRFTRMLAVAGSQPQDTEAERREFARRVIALDPLVDQALGESSRLRYHSPILQRAIHGLFRALNGWRGIATHLHRSLEGVEGQQAQTILRNIPPELRSAGEPGASARWMADPMALRRVCDQAVQTLLALPADSPSLRLLVDKTAAVLGGMSQLLDGLMLLTDAPGRLPPGDRSYRLSVPDWLPAFVNAARAFLAISAVELFWVVTAWPNGALAIVFTAIVVLLLSPKGDLAYGAALAFGLGTFAVVPFAAIVRFAVLPALQGFPAFCGALGLFLVPIGFAVARSRNPAAVAIFTAMNTIFIPLLSPTNVMSYDTIQFYNTALAIVVGCVVPPVAFRLLPPLSPALRAQRLLALSLRDLRRLAVVRVLPRVEDWEVRLYGRLGALPDQAEPLQRGQLLAALSVGTEIIHLRHMAPRLGVAMGVDAALAGFAQGNSAIVVAGLSQLDRRLASGADAGLTAAMALRLRGRILVICEALAKHHSYFDMAAA
jgi:uncharacterized membrane protein YccC